MKIKYVIYKGTGGLIHMLNGLIYCIVWCKKNNHYLIIDVKSHLCFQHNIIDFFDIINFKNFSEDYSIIDKNLKFHKLNIDYIANYGSIEVNTGINNTHYYLLDKINLRKGLQYYQKEENIKIYAGPGGNCVGKLHHYIRIKKDIMELIYKVNINNLEKNKYIGVHFRNTDRKNNINKYINILKNYKDKYIYLATDDSTAFDIIIKEIPNLNIIRYTIPHNGNGQPIHYTENNKYKLILNLLIDIYYLYNSEIFIDSPESLVSIFINRMRLDNKNYLLYLIYFN